MAKKSYQYFTKAIPLPGGGRKFIRGKTQQELDERVKAAQLELSAGINIGDSTTVKELGEMWFTLTKSTLRATTQQSARGMLQNHIYPKLGAMKVRDVEPINIQYMMLDISGSGKVLQSRVLSTARGIFQMGVDNGIILCNPVGRSIKAGGKPTAEKMSLPIAVCDKLLVDLEGTDAGLFVLLGLHTGMRRGKLCGLMWSDVDFKKHTIRVCRNNVLGWTSPEDVDKKLKTQTSYRTLPLSTAAEASLLKEKNRGRSLYVFRKSDGAMITSQVFQSMWKKVTDVLPDGVVCTPHILRHTYHATFRGRSRH